MGLLHFVMQRMSPVQAMTSAVSTAPILGRERMRVLVEQITPGLGAQPKHNMWEVEFFTTTGRFCGPPKRLSFSNPCQAV
ncbi:hypothetical protein [Fluviibacterium sp. S390]|uniref:hypothetical protein n=1 Tax=Fluviibacterium sp. S390 TaxID=3415139 RepID=UPI003C7E9EAC